MARRIPPLNPLRVFAVVARTRNLTAAAEQLHVTQSAVSRQIGALEAYLGVTLFRRDRHGVTPTRAGEQYAAEVLPAFEVIEAATERLVQGSDPASLRVRTYTTFAARWLIPHLPAFKQRHPAIDVRIVNGVPDVDFDRDAVDLAIQYGDGHWPGLASQHLFADEIEPVCTPAYRDRLAPSGPAALLGERLLVSQYRRSDWDDWLADAGLASAAAGSERMVFSSSVLTWQAALDGLGIAIGQTALLAAELASGRLVRPFGHPLRRGNRGHWLVRPAVQRPSRKVDAFSDWLLETVAAEQR